MITTDVPAWLRRSDQAVTWARTMLPPAAPSSSTARQQICRGGVTEGAWWTLMICFASSFFGGRPVSRITPSTALALRAGEKVKAVVQPRSSGRVVVGQ